MDKDDVLLVLLNSVYLAGFAVGPLAFGPLSEYLGRQPVLIGTYIGYTIFTMACALAPTYASLLVFRSLCGIHAAAPNAVLGGLYSDIYDDHGERGTAMGFFMLMTTLGPQLSPIISGYAALLSWRWVFWVALMIAGGGMPVVLLLPETYGPVLANRRRRNVDGARWEPDCARRGRDSVSMARIFGRPFAMVVQEPILLFSSLYLALVYGVLYLFFQAYPIVFQGE